MFRRWEDDGTVATEVQMFQTSDPDRYLPMLLRTGDANRAFCRRHGIGYSAFIGIHRGFFPWHATFNRIMHIRALLQAGYRGWLLYLDADAFVHDQSFDIHAYLATHAGKALVICHGASDAGWDVNAGVFFLNFASREGRDIATRWIDDFMAVPDDMLRAAADWDRSFEDQSLLQGILRQSPYFWPFLHHEGRDTINDLHSRFVRQVLRAHEPDFTARLARISFMVQESLHAAGHAAAVDDQLVRAGYRLILGRNPESSTAIHAHLGVTNATELGRILLGSDEFRARFAAAPQRGG